MTVTFLGVILILPPWQPPIGPEKVLLVSSSQTVVDVRPEAKDATISNLEIKVSISCGEIIWYILGSLVTSFSRGERK